MTTSSTSSTARRVAPATRLRGEIWPPGDKSISHRVAMFGAIAAGRSTAENFLTGADCLSTLSILAALSVESSIEPLADGRGRMVVNGSGFRGLREAADVLDAGNSGTTMRLMTGLLSPQPFLSIISGDASLRSRPMARVIEPLRRMGADLHGRGGDRLPPLVIAGRPLHGVDTTLPVASAQVKSSLVLAGLYAEGPSTIREPAATRDHTERLLRAMGAHVTSSGCEVRVEPVQDQLEPLNVRVPGDISAAAFWLVAALAHPDAEIVLRGVGMNETRTGIVDALRAMGGSISVEDEREQGGEPVADLVARSSHLRGTVIEGALIPRLIDEIPVLAVAAAVADGDTIVHDAAELRVKESDRIAATARELRRFGARIDEHDDGMTIHGGTELHAATGRSDGDHRLAMTIAVAALLAKGETSVEDAEAVTVSYPDFWADLGRLSGAPAAT
jgi:3-phosphoshikimate 1-carboxyvinyltransferase